MGGDQDMRRVGCHIVPTGGKSHLIVPLAIAKQLDISTFVLFDADAHIPDRDGRRELQRKDNSAILRLCGYEQEAPLPDKPLWKDDLVMWNTEIGQVVASDFELEQLTKFKAAARLRYDNAGDLEKNSLFVSEWLCLAWKDGCKSKNLLRLCDAIAAHCGVGTSPRPATEGAAKQLAAARA
jgi:hypothetical protein